MKAIIIIVSILTFLYFLGELYTRYVTKTYRFFDALAMILFVGFLSSLNPITWIVYGIRVGIEKINGRRRVCENH